MDKTERVLSSVEKVQDVQNDRISDFRWVLGGITAAVATAFVLLGSFIIATKSQLRSAIEHSMENWTTFSSANSGTWQVIEEPIKPSYPLAAVDQPIKSPKLVLVRN